MKIILFVGDDNQIYQVPTVNSKPMQTVIDSRTGLMTITPLKENGKES